MLLRHDLSRLQMSQLLKNQTLSTCHGADPSLVQTKATYNLWSKDTLQCSQPSVAQVSFTRAASTTALWRTDVVLSFLVHIWPWRARLHQLLGVIWDLSSCPASKKPHLSRLVHFQGSGISDPHQSRVQLFSSRLVLGLVDPGFLKLEAMCNCIEGVAAGGCYRQVTVSLPNNFWTPCPTSNKFHQFLDILNHKSLPNYFHMSRKGQNNVITRAHLKMSLQSWSAEEWPAYECLDCKISSSHTQPSTSCRETICIHRDAQRRAGSLQLPCGDCARLLSSCPALSS